MTRRRFGLTAATSLLFAVGATIGSLVGLPVSTRAQEASKPSPRATSDAARTADRDAVAGLMAAFAKTFEMRDAKALAGHWTVEGEYEHDAGLAVRGREALEQAFDTYFSKTPEVSVVLRTTGVRFLSRDTAICDGEVTLRTGPVVAPTRGRFTALTAREEGRWKLAKLSETTVDELSIEDLSWLIGEWRSSTNAGAEVRTTYAWSPTKKFIHVDFTVKEKDLSLTGKQIIGVDPASGQFRSWTFGADGGVGEADWSRDDDHWVLAASGTLADGRKLDETNLLRRINQDAFTWQSIARTLDGRPFPDLPPVKVSRVKPQP